MGFDFEHLDKESGSFPASVFSQRNYTTNSHRHYEFEIIYINKGNGTLLIEDKTIYAKTGEIFFIYPGTEHTIKNISSDFYYYDIVFDNSIIGTGNDDTRKLFDQIIVDRKILLPEEILKNIIETSEIYSNKSFGFEIAVKSLIYTILFTIIKTNQYAPLPSFESPVDNRQSITKGIQYIKEHYTDNITLEDLLKCTNYSKSHFIRLFKAATGVNYTDYLNRYRVEKACKELFFSKKNITQIASENGFNNIQYFSKIFKKYMECTPKQYQKKWKLK